MLGRYLRRGTPTIPGTVTLLKRLVATVEHLTAELAERTAERDAADADIRQVRRVVWDAAHRDGPSSVGRYVLGVLAEAKDMRR